MSALSRRAARRSASRPLACAALVLATVATGARPLGSPVAPMAPMAPVAPGVPASASPGAPAVAPAQDATIRRGFWNATQVPDGWVKVDTRHYQVQCQAGRDTAEALAAHVEALLELYQAFLPTTRSLDPFVVKVFADRKALTEYGTRHDLDATGAYFDREMREILVWDTGVVLARREVPTGIHLDPDRSITLPHAEMQRVLKLLDDATAAYTPDTAALLAHEGWHQYFLEWTVSWVPTPAWLEEGIADWFAAARPDDGGRYRVGALNDGRLRDVQRALEEGTTVHTESLLRLSTAEYYARDEVYYAQGWSLVQFLMQHREQAWRELVPRLLERFRDTKEWQTATSEVTKDIDLDRLHGEWTAWVVDQKPLDPLRDLAREFGDRIRPDQLVADDAIRRLYDWHLRHPNAPSRGGSRLR